MKKVIIGFYLREDADIKPALSKLRSYALNCTGFISAENIRSEQNPKLVVMQTNWDTIDDWHECESSRLWQNILQEARKLIVTEPRVTTYTIVPISGWGSLRLQ